MHRVVVPIVIGLACATARGGPPAADAHPVERAAEYLNELAPLVETACGARFETPPKVLVLTADDAAAAFAADLSWEIERRHPTLPESARRRLVDQKARGAVASTVARYSVSRKAVLVVRTAFDSQREALGFEADRATDLLRAVLAHECVHALDDARFDLARLYRDAADEEGVRARAMIVEGRAVVFGRRAARAAKLADDVVLLLPGGKEPKGIPAFMARLTYELGAACVERALAIGGASAADELLRRPPVSTRLVCHDVEPADSASVEGGAARRADGDARARSVLELARLDDAEVLSELELRARYAALHGRARSDALFAAFRGGAQAVATGVNHAVLVFADDAAARRFAEISVAEAPTERVGEVVVRTAGVGADERIAALIDAAKRQARAR